MHYLKQLIEKPVLKDPAKEHMNIHRHFYRYSKGDFLGPAIKITKTKPRITVKGAHEYEDLILEVIANTIKEETFNVKGALITGKDLKDTIMNLGLDWPLKKSTGKTKNYTSIIDDDISKKILLEAIEVFRENSYLLLSLNVSPTCKVTTKKRIPQPSKKKAEEDDVSKRIGFSTGVMNNTDKNLNLVIDSALPDFKAELPKTWKSIILTNNYKITEIILPKDIKNSALLRIMAIRKGKITRTINVDGEIIEKQYSMVV